MQAASDAADELKSAYDAIFGSAMSMVEAEIAARDKVVALKDSFADAEATTDDHVASLLAAVQGYNELAGATMAQTKDQERANAQWYMNVAALIETARQAGATTEEFAELARALNLPDEVLVALRTPGADAAKILLESLPGILAQIPSYKNIDVNAKIRAHQIMDDGKLVGVRVGNIELRAAGGVIRQREHAIVGEAGPEAIIPLGNSPAARNNRSNVMAQAGLVGALPVPMSSGGAVTNVSQKFDITVNVPPTADASGVGQAVVDALVAWSRRNGALPVRVAS
jgi:hypothetical protein